MSQSNNVIVIGGGVIGLSCAWRLAQQDVAVTVIDMRSPGGGASGAALGALWLSTPLRGASEIKNLHQKSLLDYQAFTDELLERTGIDSGYRRCGRFELIISEEHHKLSIQEAELMNRTQDLWNLDPAVEIVDPAEAKRIEPQVVENPFGVIHCNITAKVEPPMLVQALRKACELLDVTFIENCRIQQFDFQGDCLVGVSDGVNRYCADQFLVTSGAWTSQLSDYFLRQASVIPVRGQAMLLRAEKSPLSRIVKNGGVFLVPRDERHLVVGATTETQSGFDETVTEKGIGGIHEAAVQTVPSLKSAGIVKTWAGLRPMAADRKPFIGKASDKDNVYIAAGHYKTGIGMAPVTAEIVSALMVGEPLRYDVSSLQPGRIKYKMKKT